MTAWDLLTFRDSLLRSNQFWIAGSSVLTDWIMDSSLLPDWDTTVSSAKRIVLKKSEAQGMSLTLLTYSHAEAAATYPLLFFQQLLQKA